MTQIQVTIDIDDGVQGAYQMMRLLNRHLSMLARDAVRSDMSYQMTIDGTPVEAKDVRDRLDEAVNVARLAQRAAP